MTFETFRFAAADGRAVEGALLMPPDAATPPPVLLVPHGGPWSRNARRRTFWDEAMVRAGYAVVFCNVRGSLGYGADHMRANRGDCGGADLADLIAAFDHIVASGRVDGGRAGVAGWSYGGTLAAWALATDARFRAGVVAAGVVDWVSDFGTEDMTDFAADAWFLGDPLPDPEPFVHSSPLYHMSAVRAPTLILHGERDANNPVGQAHQLQRALMSAGAPVDLVVYPTMGHGPQTLDQHVDVLGRVLDWFDLHLTITE